MALQFKTPSQVANDYLKNLKALRPEVNIDQTDSDWWVRSRPIGGVVAGVYADQKAISNDAFAQSARHDALVNFLQTYFGSGFNPATAASGNVLVTGTPGSVVLIGTQLLYDPNGNAYGAASAVTLVGTTGIVPVVSVSTGQSQNLLSGAFLSVSNPPTGIDTGATAITDIADGKDEESDQEAAARVLARIRSPISGGTASDYRQWAFEANPSVTSASVFRFLFGLGTVGVYITAGTTDIDQAIDNDQAIARVPSQSLIDIVQAYIDTKKPVTDCHTVLAASEVPQDVTVRVAYAEGITGSTVLTLANGTMLTADELVAREVDRALYKIPVGGRAIGGSGFVLASEIEESLDTRLSGEAYESGSINQILLDRQVNDLTASGTNRMVLPNEIVKPGTVSVVAF